jgi:hypothetical protein
MRSRKLSHYVLRCSFFTFGFEMNTSLVDSRWRTMMVIFVITGWVNACVNFFIALAFLILTPPYGGQQGLLKMIGGLMLLLSTVQAFINTGLNRRAEWARKIAWHIAFLEFFQPPFGTIHAVLAFALLRRQSAMQWFV